MRLPLVCCNGSDPTYDGWYLEAGLFLTGETRSYKEGEFGRIKVKNPVPAGARAAAGALGKSPAATTSST